MRVARTIKGLNHGNTLVLRKVKIYFQCFPGKHGEETRRGIADLDYTLKVGGRVVDKGKTGPDGGVEIAIPAGQRAELVVLGTTYEVQIVNHLEPVDQEKGQQQRLSMLGYQVGALDGLWGEKSDRAVMNFQGDEGLDPESLELGGDRAALLRAPTLPKLRSTFGE